MQIKLLVYVALSFAACSCSSGGIENSVESTLTSSAPTPSGGIVFDTTTPTDNETSTSSSADPTTTTLPPSTTAPAPRSARDWDGVQWDIGALTAIRQEADGIVITFDRAQVYLGETPSDAPDFLTEPIVVGNTDVPTVNNDPTLREYSVADTVEYLEVTNLDATCAYQDFPEDPVWVPQEISTLLAVGSLSGEQTSLTFNGAGEVTRIRHGQGC